MTAIDHDEAEESLRVVFHVSVCPEIAEKGLYRCIHRHACLFRVMAEIWYVDLGTIIGGNCLADTIGQQVRYQAGVEAARWVAEQVSVPD